MGTKSKKYSGINLVEDDNKNKKLREEILKLSEEYFKLVHKQKNFIPDKTIIAASTKYLTEEDLVNLITLV